MNVLSLFLFPVTPPPPLFIFIYFPPRFTPQKINIFFSNLLKNKTDFLGLVPSLQIAFI